MSGEASREQMLKYLTDSMEVVTNTLRRSAAQDALTQAQGPSKAQPKGPHPSTSGQQPQDTATKVDKHRQMLNKQIIQHLSAAHLAAHKQLLSPPPSTIQQQQQQLKAQQQQLIQRELQSRLYTSHHPNNVPPSSLLGGQNALRAPDRAHSDILPHLPSQKAHRYGSPGSTIMSTCQNDPRQYRPNTKPAALPQQPVQQRSVQTAHPTKVAAGGHGTFKLASSPAVPPQRPKAGTVPLTEAALQQLPLKERPSSYRHVPSEIASHADWWKTAPCGMSEMSYPRTAVTDRESVSPSEFALWESKMNELERTLKEEREKRLKFEQDLKHLQSVAASRGSLTTGMATAGDRPRLNAGQMQMAQKNLFSKH